MVQILWIATNWPLERAGEWDWFFCMCWNLVDDCGSLFTGTQGRISRSHCRLAKIGRRKLIFTGGRGLTKQNSLHNLHLNLGKTKNMVQIVMLGPCYEAFGNIELWWVVCELCGLKRTLGVHYTCWTKIDLLLFCYRYIWKLPCPHDLNISGNQRYCVEGTALKSVSAKDARWRSHAWRDKVMKSTHVKMWISMKSDPFLRLTKWIKDPNNIYYAWGSRNNLKSRSDARTMVVQKHFPWFLSNFRFFSCVFTCFLGISCATVIGGCCPH